jgi:hypothetical protein
MLDLDPQTLMGSTQRSYILNDCFTLCRKHNGPREVGSGMQEQDPDPDPDPLVRGKDPRIRIRSNT